MFRGRVQQLDMVVLLQTQIAFILTQHIGADLILGQVLNVIPGATIGKEGHHLTETLLLITAVSRRQGIKSRSRSGFDTQPIEEVPTPLLWQHQGYLPLLCLLDPAGQPAQRELVADALQRGRRLEWARSACRPRSRL